MKKFGFAAAVLAATVFSGQAFALPMSSAKGLQVSNDAVKVCYHHRGRHSYYRGCDADTHIYVSRTCPSGPCGYLNRLWWPY